MGGFRMYRKRVSDQLSFKDFYLPFGGKLSGNNRWVVLAELIPWDRIEKLYVKSLANERMGPPAKSARTAFAALIIQERLNLTDEETVLQIQENPYLQYFIGYREYKTKPPFDSSLLVHFRKRINLKIIRKINEEMIALQSKAKDKEKKKGITKNKGKLIIDTTCVPNDIRYPTDISILNEAREKSEKIIDELHLANRGKKQKVRTYRQKARKDYLRIAKKRKPRRKEIRKAVGKQLRYIKRDLGYIEKMAKEDGLKQLSRRGYKNLLVVQEVYRQQELMFRENINRIKGRIVSISQPHIRPIVRGKAGVAVEFGSKITLSIVDGYTYLERLSWEAYNESEDLKREVERYKKRYGVYPESVHVDQIYRTRENRGYCKELGIRMSGKALGRAKKIISREELKQKKKQSREDFIYRIAVEGKIGEGKRRYGLNRIMTKLAETSETVIGMIIFIMNLERMVVDIFFVSIFTELLSYFQGLNLKTKGIYPVRMDIICNVY